MSEQTTVMVMIQAIGCSIMTLTLMFPNMIFQVNERIARKVMAFFRSLTSSRKEEASSFFQINLRRSKD